MRLEINYLARDTNQHHEEIDGCPCVVTDCGCDDPQAARENRRRQFDPFILRWWRQMEAELEKSDQKSWGYEVKRR